jgi:HxlR-like helix-turn-helix protein
MNLENLLIPFHPISKMIDVEPEDNTKIKSKKIATDVCKALGIWDTIGKKWSLLILRHLSANDNLHFNEIKRLLGISSNVLAKKLKVSKGIRCHFHRLREMDSQMGVT